MRANQHTGPLPLSDRFWDKVKATSANECWGWTGSKTPQGYGRLNINRIPVPAHRVGYELLIGPVPQGLELDHLCRNPSCVNPNHLEPVTTRENSLRGFGWAGKNARKTICAEGHGYTKENTIWVTNPGRLPHRRCATCSRRWAREAYRRRMEKVPA